MYLNRLIIIILIIFASCADGKKKSIMTGSSKDITVVNGTPRNKLKLFQLDSLIKVKKRLTSDSLIIAVQNNDLVLVQHLISQGVDVNYRVSNAQSAWESPLSEAVRTNNEHMVKLLVNNCADPNLDLGENLSPFQLSAGGCLNENTKCSDSIFNFLLTKGGNVNAINEHRQMSVLMTAVSSGNLKNTLTLIKNGANLEFNPHKSPSLLGLAVNNLDYEMVSFLIKSGVNVNAQYSDASADDCQLCTYNITVMHPLVLTSNKYNAKAEHIIDLILLSKPDLNIQNDDGHTPLHFAMAGTNYALVEKLISHGAKLETAGKSALHFAAQWSNFSMVAYLLKKNINVNVQDQEGNTSLMLCVRCCGNGFDEGITPDARLKTIAVLLDNGADPTIVNSKGESFIEDCKKSGRMEILDFLTAHGFFPKVK
jgi:ankyrin repeat protein